MPPVKGALDLSVKPGLEAQLDAARAAAKVRRQAHNMKHFLAGNNTKHYRRAMSVVDQLNRRNTTPWRTPDPRKPSSR